MNRPNVRWFQFGVRSVICVTLIVALVFTWWRQWSQHREIASLRARLNFLERNAQINSNAFLVCRALDLKNPEHRWAAKMLYTFGPWPFASTERRDLTLGGRQVSVIVLHEPDCCVPGTVATIVALVADSRLVDLIQREVPTEGESHDVRLEDVNSDGALDVVFDCESRFIDPSPPTRLAYTISDKGFKRID